MVKVRCRACRTVRDSDLPLGAMIDCEGCGRRLRVARERVVSHGLPLEVSEGMLDRKWAEAPCVGKDPEWWFAEPASEEGQYAVGVCGTCALRVECLQLALAVQAWEGIFGGLTARERRRLGPRL